MLTFLRLFWKPLLLAALLLGIVGALCLHIRHDNATELALIAQKVENATLAATYQAAIDHLTRDLADAKTAGAKAVSDRIQAEKDAAKKLAAKQKEWAKIYGAKPENKAWADSLIPADVAGKLREQP